MYCSNILLQGKPVRRGGEHRASLIPNAIGGPLCPAAWSHLVPVQRHERTLARKKRPPSGCQMHVNGCRLSPVFLLNWDAVTAQSMLEELLWLKNLNGKCFTRKQMFSFCFCNLTIAAGKEVGVPGSESKVDWPGTESKWIFFFFLLASWKGNKKGKWAWRGKEHCRLWRILEPKAVFSKLRDELNFPNNVCWSTQINNRGIYELAVYLVWPCKDFLATSQWSKQNSSPESPGLSVLQLPGGCNSLWSCLLSGGLSSYQCLMIFFPEWETKVTQTLKM